MPISGTPSCSLGLRIERFAFVASHDLQEPLRMITVYSQLPIKTYADKFDESAAMFVSHIAGGTKRMRELLSDLLAYTETGARPEQPVKAVDLNGVIDKVSETVRIALDGSNAAITADRERV